MSSSSLPDDVRAFLAKPNPAVIATVRRDGQPISVATWYLLEDDGRILVNMDEGRKRLSYLRNDPRVSLTVLADRNWYTHISVQGVAVLSDDDGLTDIDRLSRHYTGRPYPVRNRARINAHIRVEHWHRWGEKAVKPS